MIKIFFGKIKSKINNKETYSTVTQKYFINIVRDIIINHNSDDKKKFLKNKILYNSNPKVKGTKIDDLLDANIQRRIKYKSNLD